MRPNPSLEPTRTGMALGPRGALAYRPPRGPSTTPALAPQLKRWANSQMRVVQCGHQLVVQPRLHARSSAVGLWRHAAAPFHHALQVAVRVAFAAVVLSGKAACGPSVLRRPANRLRTGARAPTWRLAAPHCVVAPQAIALRWVARSVGALACPTRHSSGQPTAAAYSTERSR